MTPQFKFEFFHDILAPAGIIVNEPLGWKDAEISLTRDPVYNSLIEYFKGTFIWYGKARQFIIDAETLDFFDAKIGVKISIRYNYVWDEVFMGALDIEALEDISKAGTFYKCTCPIIRDDFWAKLIARKAMQVDLASSTDLDGNAITPIASSILNLPCQVLEKNLVGYLEIGFNISGWSFDDFLQIDTDIDLIAEITTKYNIPNDKNVSLPASIFQMDEDGQYTFDLRMEASMSTPDFGLIYAFDLISFYIQKNSDAPILFSVANYTDIDGNKSTVYTYNGTLSLNKGDAIRVYGKFLTSPDVGWELVVYGHQPFISPTHSPSGNTKPFSWNVVGETTLLATVTDSFTIWDAGKSIIEKLVGRTGALIGDYARIGCASTYKVMKGLHVRGYSLADKPFFMSLDEWFGGFDPIQGLGLGYQKLAGIYYVVIENIAYFFNRTPSIALTFQNLTRTYDNALIAKSIQIGYEKYAAESDSGVDDPQTEHTYAPILRTSGIDIKLMSKFWAASLGIEQTRRNRVEFGKDWRLDNDTIIIATNHSDASQPELMENYAGVSNLLNASSRYNLRLTPGRNFFRSRVKFNGALYNKVGQYYIFRAGKGNIDMISDLDEPDCDGITPEQVVAFAENQNILIDSDRLCLPVKYKGNGPLSWGQYKTIRDLKEQCITANGKDMFIWDFDYKIARSSVNVDLRQA